MNPIILHTTDYDRFIRLKSNRPVKERDVKKLAEKIQRKNLLHLFPVLINSKWEIIDGQHRIEAARMLGLQVYYIMDDDVTSADIAIINNTRKSWNSRDYIHFYAQEGRSEYKKLERILHKYPKITIGTGARLMDAKAKWYFQGGGNFSLLVRSGEINSDMFLTALRIADLCFKLSKKYDYAFYPAFMMGIKNIIMSSAYSSKKCVELIYQKRNMLPSAIELDDTCLFVFKQMLAENKEIYKTSSRKVEVNSPIPSP